VLASQRLGLELYKGTAGTNLDGLRFKKEKIWKRILHMEK